MNEPVKDSDIVMIINDNYNLNYNRFHRGDIAKVYKRDNGLFFIELIHTSYVGIHVVGDDLGYYSYKKVTQNLWYLL